MRNYEIKEVNSVMPQYAILTKKYREEMPQVADAIFEIIGEYFKPIPPCSSGILYKVYRLKVVDNALPRYMGMTFSVPEYGVRLGKKVHMETTQEELDNFISGNGDVQKLLSSSQ